MRWSCTRWGLWCPPKGHEYHRKLPGGETARVAPFPELLGAERKYWAAGSMWQWSPQPWCCHSWEFGRLLIGFSMQGFAPVARPGCRNSHTGISREPLPTKRRTGVPSQPTAPRAGAIWGTSCSILAGNKRLWCPHGDHRVHSPTWDPRAAKVWGDFGKAKPPEGCQDLLRSLHCVGAATLFKNLATNLYHTVLKLDHFACIAVLGERFRYTFELSDFYFFFTIQYKEGKMYVSPLFSLYETGWVDSFSVI